MSIYGVNTWAMSTYESRRSLIANYIRPIIGDMKLEDVTPRIMDKYYRDLLSVKAVSTKFVKARHEYLTPHTVRPFYIAYTAVVGGSALAFLFASVQIAPVDYVSHGDEEFPSAARHRCRLLMNIAFS